MVPILEFPDPTTADEDGLIGIGGDLHPESLLLAYRQGIFPWPMPGAPLAWFCPQERAILNFKDIHVPRSLDKEIRKNYFRFAVNQHFEKVIGYCRSLRKGSTWITQDMKNAYIEFHHLGFAHSFEVYNSDDQLVGGLYGVGFDGCFAGESMFHLEPNASKLAILFCAQKLQEIGVEWLDIQMLTPHLKALGAVPIQQAPFLDLLKKSRARSNLPKLSLRRSSELEILLPQKKALPLSK